MMLKTIKTEQLTTEIYATRAEMGRAAARVAADAIRTVLETKEYANVIFAAAPSQNEMLASLLAEDVDFSRVNAFHMDEYVGLPETDPRTFAHYLDAHIFSLAPFRSAMYIGSSLSPEEACLRYAALLADNPPDVVCMGIGENGHIAFNDPPVADFCDPYAVKTVALDEVCRMQQVHDGCFATLHEVPTHAVTLTVPTLLSARYLICTVPAPSKAAAVRAMLCGPYGECCPATALRRHGGARMFLDADSAAEVIVEC